MIKAAENNIKFRENEIKELFKNSLGYELNLDNPKTFNEKIQWLKLYNHDPLITKCADKYLVREYVKEKIGEEYLIPLLGVWDNPDDINFDALPNQFVLKVNWGWAQNIIVKDKSKLNIKEAKEKLKNWLKPLSNHYYHSFEWSYKNIQPKIICEKYIEQIDGNLFDYKIFCFNDNIKCIGIYAYRNTENFSSCFYDENWNLLNLDIGITNKANINLEKPIFFEKMLKETKKLSYPFPHVRVDWYYINGQLSFGELTFYTSSGFGKFKPIEWDYKFGELLKLPAEKRIEYDTLTKNELIAQACNLEYISRDYKNIQNKEEDNKTTNRFILFGIENFNDKIIIYFFGIKMSFKKFKHYKTNFKYKIRPDQTRPDQTRPDQTSM